MDNYRQLLQELMDAIDSGIPVDRIRNSPLAVRIDAALDQPAPPAEGEVAGLVEFLRVYGDEVMDEYGDVGEHDMLTRAADLLEQYQAAPVPAEAEVEKAPAVTEVIAWLRTEAEIDDGFELTQSAAYQRRAADLLERQAAPVPVAVSERLPEPEDCDAEGRCWWFNPGQPAMSNPHIATSSWRLCRMLNGKPMGTHWLPAAALPCLSNLKKYPPRG